jgi:hypothetical protein
MPETRKSEGTEFPFERAPSSFMEGFTSDFNLIAGSENVQMMSCEGCSAVNAINLPMFNNVNTHILGGSRSVSVNTPKRNGNVVWQFTNEDVGYSMENKTDYVFDRGDYYQIYWGEKITLYFPTYQQKYFNFFMRYINLSRLDGKITIKGISIENQTTREINVFRIPGSSSSSSWDVLSVFFCSIDEFLMIEIESAPLDVSISESLYVQKYSKYTMQSGQNFTLAQTSEGEYYLSDENGGDVGIDWLGGGDTNTNLLNILYSNLENLSFQEGNEINVPSWSVFSFNIFNNPYYQRLGATTALINDDQSMFFCDNGLFVEGDVNAFYSSDALLKKDKKTLNLKLSDILSIKPACFVWRDNNKTYTGQDIGFIAQDLENVCPLLVIERNDGYKAVDYEKTCVISVHGVKMINECIQRIKEKIQIL